MSLAASKLSATAAHGSLPAPVRQRAQLLWQEQRDFFTLRVDRSFALLLGVQYVASVLLTLLFAPAASGRAWLAFSLGGLFTAVPLALALLQPGQVVTRHTVAVGQMLMSGLLVHLTGGRIETHFHLFGSLAFLSFYRDWRVLATASAVAVLDLAVRGTHWPMSVFGTPVADHWRWLEHTGWILFEDVVLIVSIRQSQQMMSTVAERRAELEQARDVAEHASRAKDEFLAVLSHELRTPLTPSLLTLASLCEDERLEAELRDELATVKRNVELEARLIDDLLDITRITSGKLELSTGHVDLHSIFRHILETSRPEFAQRQLHVTCQLRAEKYWVYGDSARLQQVFWNLLRNAMKFTPASGRIEVKTQDAGEKIRIDVVDSGIGIAPELLPKIFQRYEQGGSSVTRQYGGLGLGLSICRSIVEMHRGHIRADSRGRGWGSTFTIALPVQAAPPSIVPITHTQKLRLSGVLPRRVLLVDDHADTRETLARLLNRTGYQVTTADSVSTALERAGQAKFDLLVSDLGLPDGHGYDLMREMRERHGLPGVAVSGFGMEEDVRKSLEAGFSAHLTKPVDFKKLKEVMGRALSNTERAAALAGQVAQ